MCQLWALVVICVGLYSQQQSIAQSKSPRDNKSFIHSASLAHSLDILCWLPVQLLAKITMATLVQKSRMEEQRCGGIYNFNEAPSDVRRGVESEQLVEP